MMEGKKQRGARRPGAGVPDRQSAPQSTSSPRSILHPGQTFFYKQHFGSRVFVHRRAQGNPLCRGGEFCRSSGVSGRAEDTYFRGSRPVEPPARTAWTSSTSPAASSRPGQELAPANCGLYRYFGGRRGGEIPA